MAKRKPEFEIDWTHDGYEFTLTFREIHSGLVAQTTGSADDIPKEDFRYSWLYSQMLHNAKVELCAMYNTILKMEPIDYEKVRCVT